jgi:hypothetical protein
MAHKTYVPHLRFVFEVAYKYGSRYQTQLAQNLTSEQASCLASTLTALAQCLILLGPPNVNP